LCHTHHYILYFYSCEKRRKTRRNKEKQRGT
jgi:hypothetical protein